MDWYENIVIGETIDLGSHTFTAEDVIRYARLYDPQPFHTDPDAARSSRFGALCTSGWHTTAVWMRLMTTFMRREAEAGRRSGQFGPSPGFRSLKWLRPVYAGETIRFRSTIEAKRPLQSHPGWGLVRMRNEGVNAEGQPVISFVGSVMVARRAAEGGAGAPPPATQAPHP